ncbi:OLC1v1001442C1 [Oldenlandia corymbosa var. corymbosa]|uniref:OLC1v1001442C1 n=1 Tax=Oldenlandia corymbosa var. corymbosa TaxID=529605 RepID=A0AAV1D601_OLDCO|nr:OLC1v1001442C1 [Oldenlandia corymbosa var. corymbosa]
MEYWKWKLKKYHTCVDSAIQILKSIHEEHHLSHSDHALKFRIWAMILDLNFLKMFFWGLGFPEELLGADGMLRLTFMAERFRRAAKGFQMGFEAAAGGDKITNWDLTVGPLETFIQVNKPEISKMCIHLLSDDDDEFKCKYSPLPRVSPDGYRDDTDLFMQFIRRFLAVFGTIVHLLPPVLEPNVVKQQFASIERKIELFGKFVSVLDFKGPRSMRIRELMCRIQTWASHVSCLLCLYWIDGTDPRPSSTMANRLSDLMKNLVSADVPGTMGLFLDVFKPANYRKRQGTTLPSLLAGYIDLLLEQYVIDDVEIVREGLLFLFSFVLDTPNHMISAGTEFILAEIDAIISEVPYIMCILEKTKLSSFLLKIDGVKVKVSELYAVTTLSSQFNSPMTNVIVFLDSLLETLQEMLKGRVDFIPSVKNHVIGIHEGLALLRPFLQHVMEIPSDSGLIIDLHTQVVNLIHYASYVSKLCPITTSSVWYGILCLPNIIQDIKLAKCEVEKIEGKLFMCSNSNNKLKTEMESSNAILPQPTTSKHEGSFIGFGEDAQLISDYLLHGGKDLTIISISGMPGQGKTTLARQICHDPSINYHFHKIAWCYVSKESKKRRLLASILWGDSGVVDANIEMQDLVERVWRSLKGHRYLIVLDDIWDVDAWYQLKDSFPDDSNGSRILFTSRNDALASQCNPNSISHRLPLFSDEESWELIKDKLSYSDGFPLELEEVGRQIAVSCKGLPLAVSLIASHLKRTSQGFELWMEVLDNMKSHLASEGCMHIIEMSYKYLPHHLKPCFLYFGTGFQRGEEIPAGHLIRIWIAEGFVKENERRCSVDLGREYLEYLVSQNLVVATERGLTGKIKYCNIHDLLYDLCLQKAIEDDILHLVDYRIALNESHPSRPRKYSFHHHWVSICDKNPTFTQLTSDSLRKELPTSQVHSLLSSSRDIGPIQYRFLSSFLGRFRVLTVLNMFDVSLRGCKFPEVILFNVHLRYLALRGSFSHVPLSIANLWNLETLILYSEHFMLSLPKVLWGIKSLCDVQIVSSCLDFNDFGKNVSLTAAASQIECFEGIVLQYDVKTQEFLRNLPRLRKLNCFYKDEEFRPEWLSMFGSLQKLESLMISKCYETDSDGKLLFSKHGGLLFPNYDCRNLKLNFPEPLKKLSLWNLELPWSAMSTIGQLPNLLTLKLHFNAFKGPTWDLQDGAFSKLKYLKLYWMNVQQINDSDCCENPPFPFLERLFVYYCKRLEEIPRSFGEIYTLNTIRLVGSPRVSDLVASIVEEQLEMGNQDLQLVVLDQVFGVHDRHYKEHEDRYKDEDNDSDVEQP